MTAQHSFVASLLLGLCAAPLAAADKRPNVLWITCEDMSPNLGCYGDPYAVTPNLDRLAAQGVRCTHAFTVAGVCAPSRSCLITGMYPSSLGTHHMRCTGRLPKEVTCFTEPLRAAGYYCTNNVKTDYNFPPPRSAWDESSNRAHWRKRKPGQPFFSVFNFTVTHESQIRAPEAAFQRQTARLTAAERHDPAKAPLPPFYPDTPVVRRDWARHSDLITAMDKLAGDLLKQLDDDGLADDTVVFFYSDHGVGLPRGKRWLYDTGMRVPLLVRFGKNFAALAPGKPGSTSDRLVSFVDFGPTVQSLAGVKVAAHIQGKPFLGAQAVAPREYVYGIRDRMDERYDFTRAVRDKRYKYIRNYMPHVPWAQPLEYMDEMPTMKEWRRLAAAKKLEGPSALFMAPAKPFEELYDTEKDPHEVRNLASSAEYREVLTRLRKAHVDWMIETRDLGLLPEAEIHFRATGTMPYQMARKGDEAYPLERIREAAGLAGTGTVERLMKLLGDDDSAVRYWAAVGLGVRGKGSREAALALKKALLDRSASVRVAAADALGRLGDHEAALPTLREALRHPEEWVRLHAANILDAIGKEAFPALVEMKAASRDTNQYVVRVMRHALKELDSQSKGRGAP